MGPRGNNVQKITSDHNVQIKFPEKAKAAVNGEAVNGGDTNGHGDSDIIKISGKKENCEAAAKALKALVPINIEVSLNYLRIHFSAFCSLAEANVMNASSQLRNREKKPMFPFLKYDLKQMRLA